MPLEFNGTEITKLIFNGTEVTNVIFNGTNILLNAVYNIATRNTESSILASTPSNPSGKVTLAYGTDTGNMYVYTGSTEKWRMLLSS